MFSCYCITNLFNGWLVVIKFKGLYFMEWNYSLISLYFEFRSYALPFGGVQVFRIINLKESTSQKTWDKEHIFTIIIYETFTLLTISSIWNLKIRLVLCDHGNSLLWWASGSVLQLYQDLHCWYYLNFYCDFLNAIFLK